MICMATLNDLLRNNNTDTKENIKVLLIPPLGEPVNQVFQGNYLARIKMYKAAKDFSSMLDVSDSFK